MSQARKRIMHKRLILDHLIKKQDDLVKEPVIIRVNNFNEEGVKDFSEEFHKAYDTGQPFVPVVIDSFGGSVYGLLDMITQIQSSDLKVITIVEGKAMSAGAMLFAMGHERYMGPNATLMLHDASNFSWGKVEEVKADAIELDRLNKLIFRMIAENSEQEPDFFLNMLHEKGHADWYLTPKEARKLNLCEGIGVPSIEMRVSVTTELVFN